MPVSAPWDRRSASKSPPVIQKDLGSLSQSSSLPRRWFCIWWVPSIWIGGYYWGGKLSVAGHLGWGFLGEVHQESSLTRSQGELQVSVQVSETKAPSRHRWRIHGWGTEWKIFPSGARFLILGDYLKGQSLPWVGDSVRCRKYTGHWGRTPDPQISGWNPL